MKILNLSAYITVAVLLGAIGGYTFSEWQNHSEEFEARSINYTDRGRICLEAASMIRNGDSESALVFLEDRAVSAVQGIPMGRKYDELPQKSQLLMISAQAYKSAIPEFDLEMDSLVSNVPDHHPKLSTNILSLRSTDL